MFFLRNANHHTCLHVTADSFIVILIQKKKVCPYYATKLINIINSLLSMRGEDYLYAGIFFAASVAYAFFLHRFLALPFVLDRFFLLFGVVIFLLLATILITNNYISSLDHHYLEFVSLTYAVMGVLVLLFTGTSFVFTALCAVLSIYYLVRFLKAAKL